MLARHGGPGDADPVMAALRRAVQTGGADAEGLDALVEGAGRLAAPCAAPVLRHLYRETSSSQLRGTAALALSAADPGFAAGFAVECLWDCEESTRELAAHAGRVRRRTRPGAAAPAGRRPGRGGRGADRGTRQAQLRRHVAVSAAPAVR